MSTAIDDLLDLLAIPGEPGKERQIFDTVKQRLNAIGIASENMSEDETFEQSEYGGDCGNLIVKIPGRRDGPSRMFSTHLDTVPICVGAKARLDEEKGLIVNEAPRQGARRG